jgi:hypothetical protein
MPGATRVNGSAQAGSFYGYQPLFFSVTNTATNVGTADTVPGGGAAITEGNFSKAIRGIQSVGSIVFIGTRANAGFVCAIDAATANAYVSANTDTDVAAALVAAIEASTGLTDVTVTEKTLAFSELA